MDVAAQRIGEILRRAIERGADAIHVDRLETELRVRLRVGRVLEDILVLPRLVADTITGRLKNMAGMDQAEIRLPQEGQLRLARPPALFAVSTTPGPWGESMVLHRLDAGEGPRAT